MKYEIELGVIKCSSCGRDHKMLFTRTEMQESNKEWSGICINTNEAVYSNFIPSLDDLLTVYLEGKNKTC